MHLGAAEPARVVRVSWASLCGDCGGAAGASVAGAGLAPSTVSLPSSDGHYPRTGKLAFRGNTLCFHSTCLLLA